MPLIALDAFDLRPEGKGVARALQNIIPRLVATEGEGVRFVVLATDRGAPLLEGVPRARIRIVPGMLGSVWEQVGLPLASRRLGSDLVYTQRDCTSPLGPPYVVHLHEDPSVRWGRGPNLLRERIREGYTRLIIRRSLSRALALIASSAATARALELRLGPGAPSATVVHLGVDDRFFATAAGPEEPYVFHLGSADPRDNTLAVVRAYGRLRERLPEAPPLLVAGELGALTPQILQTTEGMGVRGHVQLLGRVSDDRLARLYAGSSACLQPSSDEGFGLQPLEAMAAGAPLIAFDAPAVREIVAGGGRLVDDLSPDGLAAETEGILADPALSARLRVEGRRRARRFTWDATAAALASAFDRVLKGRR